MLVPIKEDNLDRTQTMVQLHQLNIKSADNFLVGFTCYGSNQSENNSNEQNISETDCKIVRLICRILLPLNYQLIFIIMPLLERKN